MAHQHQTISKTEKVQTAVEWLAKKYNFITWMRNRDEISAGTADQLRGDYLEQAKQMEKEQHYYSCVNVIEGVLNKVEKGEKTNSRDVFNQYYNETYGK